MYMYYNPAECALPATDLHVCAGIIQNSPPCGSDVPRTRTWGGRVPARWARGPTRRRRAEAEVVLLHVRVVELVRVHDVLLPLTKEGEVTTTVPNGNAAATAAAAAASAAMASNATYL